MMPIAPEEAAARPAGEAVRAHGGTFDYNIARNRDNPISEYKAQHESRRTLSAGAGYHPVCEGNYEFSERQEVYDCNRSAYDKTDSESMIIKNPESNRRAGNEYGENAYYARISGGEERRI